jgi:hypothetical protein
VLLVAAAQCLLHSVCAQAVSANTYLLHHQYDHLLSSACIAATCILAVVCSAAKLIVYSAVCFACN